MMGYNLILSACVPKSIQYHHAASDYRFPVFACILVAAAPNTSGIYTFPCRISRVSSERFCNPQAGNLRQRNKVSCSGTCVDRAKGERLHWPIIIVEKYIASLNIMLGHVPYARAHHCG
jgi:hypothetical protein